MSGDSERIEEVLILEQEEALTLRQVCRVCRVDVARVLDLVEEGVLAPEGSEPAHWRFRGVHVRRARVALRLQQDLGVNLAGAALAVELLEELDCLRARLQALRDG